MNLVRHTLSALLMTVVTTVLLGVVYPLVVTALAQTIFPDQANGQLILRDGHAIGSKLIGQVFSSPGYFHSRPSAAGTGYDATSSGGTNLGPTSQKLIASVRSAVEAARADNPNAPVPIDLVTSSASGLDPDISPAAALFQVPRVATARHLDESIVRKLVMDHVEGRTFGLLGEPRVNVLLLNLDLDRQSSASR
jgi:K+-transporting ATPase ATPase C chain